MLVSKVSVDQLFLLWWVLPPAPVTDDDPTTSPQGTTAITILVKFNGIVLDQLEQNC